MGLRSCKGITLCVDKPQRDALKRVRFVMVDITNYAWGAHQKSGGTGERVVVLAEAFNEHWLLGKHLLSGKLLFGNTRT